MATYVFQQVDVFTAVPFKGNPLAVIVDGNDLAEQQMAAIASWTCSGMRVTVGQRGTLRSVSCLLLLSGDG